MLQERASQPDRKHVRLSHSPREIARCTYSRLTSTVLPVLSCTKRFLAFKQSPRWLSPAVCFRDAVASGRDAAGNGPRAGLLLGVWALNLTFLRGSAPTPLGHICPRTGFCCPGLAQPTRRDWSCLQALQPDFSFSAKPIWGFFGGLWSQVLPPALPAVWLRGRGAGEAHGCARQL